MGTAACIGVVRLAISKEKTMTRRTLLIALGAMVFVPALLAQQPPDPVTGKWGRNGLTYLELEFDGKSKVSGTVVWRDPSGSYEERAPIKTGTFDPKTNALRLEGEAKNPDGAVLPYLIDGKIEKETVAGTFKFGERTGEFAFSKL
jgi:hypothetical protein